MTVWWQDPHPGSVQRNMMSFLPLPDTSSLPPSPSFLKSPRGLFSVPGSACWWERGGEEDMGPWDWVCGSSVGEERG